MKSEKMKIEWIDPAKLEVPEVRITSVFEEDIYEMFADDIAKTGVEQPLLIAKEGEHLWIIDGLNRRDQALLKGIKTVPCVVREMSLRDVQMRNLVSNRLRGRTKASEEIQVIKDLYDNHSCSIETIVDETGMKRERVEQLLQIGGVDLEVMEALDEDRIKVCHAFELSRLVDRSAQIRMLRVVLQYKMTCKVLKEAVDEALKVIADRKQAEGQQPVYDAPTIPTAECTCCHGKYPVREMSAPPLCRGCFSILISAFEAARREQQITVEGDTAATKSVEVEEGKTEGGL